MNSGKPVAAVAATATSLKTASFTVVSGQDTLNFAPVPGPGQVTSSNTFTIRVDRSVPFDFANLRWSFFISPLPPVANPGPNKTANVGDQVFLDGSGSTNPSGVGTLTYNWTFQSRPGGRARLVNPTDAITNFIVDVPGTFVITLTVSNGVASNSANVTVSTANSPPVANAGSNQTVAVGATVTLDGSHSSDIDGDPLTFAWSLTALPPGSSAVLAGANTASPSFIADKAGTYQARLVVSDPTSSSTPATVTISTVNTPPVANAGPNQLVTVGSTVQLTGAGSTDVDGDPLTYRWTLPTLPAGSTAVLSNTSAVNPTFKIDLPGTYAAQLIVNDGKVDSTPSSVTITTNALLPPTANAGNGQTVVHGHTVLLTGSGTDPQLLPLTYQWSLTIKPSGSTAVLSATNVQNPSFFADLPGTYTAQLVTNNGFLSSPASTVNITTTNSLPVANAGQDQTAAVGATVQLSGGASSDVDFDPLTYSWSILKAPAGSISQLSSTSGVSPTFVPDVAGTYVVQLIVNDGIGNSAPATVTITVVATFRMSLSPNPLNVFRSASGTFTVTLPFAAGASGQDVQLTVLDGSIVSLPNKVTIAPSGTTATFTVSGLNAGSTSVVASCQSCSYQPGSAVVNVSAATITLSLDTTNIGVSRTANGTVTLNAAPQSGNLSVALLASPADLVNIQPATVVIPQGSTTGTFTVTALAAGQTSITGSASGYTSGSVNLNIGLLGTILLPATVTVGAGQSVPLLVSLASAAPAGGVTIDLKSSDSTVATLSASSVFIPFQATTPSSLPNLNGIKQGTATITATSGGFTGGSSTANVVGALSITTASLSKGVVGANYFQTLGVDGGTGPYTWQLTGGALPNGIALNGATGQLSGKPTVAVNATPLTFTVTDSSAPAMTATASLTLTVVPALSITTPGLANGVVNVAYSQTLSATGGTGSYSWQVTLGNLPAGLTLDAASGVLSGTPTSTASAVPLTIKVTDSGTPALTATANFTITVSAQLTITNVALANGVTGIAYTQTLTAAGGVGPFTWQLTGGTLPAGLNLGASTGIINGTPTAAVSAIPLTFKVTDSATPAQTATATLALTIAPQLTITTSALPNGAVGTPYSFQLVTSGGTAPLTFQQIAGTMPSGLSLSAAGLISGSPTATANATPLSFKVTDSSSPAQTATVTLPLTISSQLTISTNALPTALVGTAYSQILNATGGTKPYTWELTSGTLPAGLNLVAATGQITGTPTAAVTAAPLTFKVTDTGTPVQTATVNLTLTVASHLTITTAALANGVVGQAYSQTVGAGGGVPPLTWQIALGTLPAGLTLNSSAGTISGTPTGNPGPSTFTISVSDSSSQVQTASAPFTLVIAAPLSIATSTLPDGIVGVPYSQSLASTGGIGPFVWQMTSGTLPTGLNLDAASGKISGTPTVFATATPLSFKVTDAGSPAQTASVTVALTVAGKLTITSSALPNGAVGSPYSQTLAASGGTGTKTWQLTSGTMPAGLSLATNGLISGSPTASATAVPLTFTVTDSGSPAQTASANFTLTIGTQLTILTVSLPNGVVGTAYSQTLAGTGGVGPYTWQLTSGNLPAGLTFDGSNGQITGTPTATATATPLTFKVTDVGSPVQTATVNLTLTIAPQLIVTTSALSNGLVGTPFSQTLVATGGTGSHSWQLTGGALPNGLSLNAATGEIAGTPTVAVNSAALSFKATDSGNPAQTASVNLTLTILEPINFPGGALPDAVVGSPYSHTLTVTGATGATTFQLTNGTIPAGLSLNGSTGLISGTPTAAVSATPLTFKVTDSGSPVRTATANMTLTVAAPLTITSGSLPNGAVGSVYSQTLTASGGTGTKTWQLTSGQLPAGLNLNGATGEISGTPTATASAVALSFKVTDSGAPAQTATANTTLTIIPKLSITTAAMPNGTVSVAYSLALAASGGSGTFTWQLTGGTIPAGLSLNASNGLISGTPTAPVSSVQLTFKVSDPGPPAQTATANLTLTIVAAPLAISTSSLPDGAVGIPYSFNLVATGGTTPYSWQLIAGRLPNGLSLDPTGLISGTPTTTSSTSFTFQVTDASSPVQTATVSLPMIIGQPTLKISTTSLPNGQVGTPYSQTLTTVAGTAPMNWNVIFGPLPPGLSLNASTGTISGTPTAAVTSSKIIVQVTDSSQPAQSAMATLFITITPLPLAIQTGSLPNGTIGTPYLQTLTVTGGVQPYSWQMTSGTLPAGLSFNASGQISGTPTANVSATPLTFTVSDSSTPVQTASVNLTLTIGGPTLSITTTTLPTGVVGTAYSFTLATSGGTGNKTWQLTSGTPPAGILFNQSTGQLSGTPTATASATPLTFKVTDSGSPVQTATANLTLTIAPPLTIGTSTLANGAVGTAYSQTLSATGGISPLSWQQTAGTLPAGLSLNAAGQISGTPTATASATPLTFKVTDSGSPAQTASVNLTLTIAPQLVITTSALPNGAIGTAYSQTLAAIGGTGAVNWQLTGGTLPAGLSLNATTGQISGTPTASANATPLTFKVTDSGSPAQSATATFTLTISGPALTVVTTSLPPASVGNPYSAQLVATGGTAPYSWSITGGRLPGGISLDSATGVISGTLQFTDPAAITVTVTDSSSPQQTASRSMTLPVASDVLAIFTSSLPNGQVGTPYSQTLIATGGKAPYSWSILSGSLPAGLGLSAAGVISGTPTNGANAQSVTIKVTDSASPAGSANATLQITIASTPLGIQTSALASGQVGVAYSQTLSVTGGIGPYTWQMTAGTLPDGLTFTAGGLLSGTPTTPVTAASLTFKVTDSSSPAQTATVSLPLTIAPATLTIATTSLPNGAVGTAYSQTIVPQGGVQPYTFQLTGGTPPAGLSLSAGGVISGMPTASASATPLTIKVTDSGTPVQTASATLTLTIQPKLTITTTLLPDGVTNVAYSQSLNAVGGAGAYTWHLTSGTLPTGLNFAAGLLSGTTSTAVTAIPLTFSVSDTGLPVQTASVNLTLTIAPPVLSITTNSLPNGQVGAPYSGALGATGGTGAYTWQQTAGTLPAGLSLNPATGAISGTPTATATATPLTFKVTDSGVPAQTASVNVTLTITPPILTITTNSLAVGQVGVAYSQTLNAIGGTGTLTWQMTSGNLPAGLLFSASGQISGTPTAQASATPLTFKVTDSATAPQTATANLTLTIGPAAPVITTTLLANGAVGSVYSQTLTANGGTPGYTWVQTGGTLPAGLTFNGATGVISGTPTATAAAIPLTFKVTDSGTTPLSATATLTLTVLPKLTITTAALANGSVGTAYSQTLIASGGAAAYTWQQTSGTLPAGLNFNGATGQISGTPTASVTALPLVFQVTDAGPPTQTATVNLTLTIAPQLVITTTNLPNGTVGTAYSATLVATGGTGADTWQLTGGTLPAGLSFSAGVISGTPTAAANATSLTFKVTDSGTPAQTATTTLTLTITPPVLSVSTATLSNGVVGTAYSQTLQASGGTGTYSWQRTAGTLPNGLSLNASTGEISGTPTAAANNVSLTFQVTDSAVPPQTASKTLTLTIAPQLTIATSALGNAIQNSSYTQTLSSNGGTGGTTWQLTGTLPTGLLFDGATGQISGIPTAAGTAASLVFKVTDSGTPQQTASVTLSLTVIPQLTITTGSLPNGTVGTAYSQALAATGGAGAKTWLQTGGTLPAGLSLSTDGVISGTPTAAVNATPLTFKVTDSGTPSQNASVNLTLTISPPAPKINTTVLPDGAAGAIYSATLSATGGTLPYTWTTTGGLPSGLTLSTAGLISGSPGSLGNFNVAITLTDAANATASATLPLKVVRLLSITTSSLPDAVVGTPYSATLLANGGAVPLKWTSTGLPPGLTLDQASGTISGTPALGSLALNSVAITVTDSLNPTPQTASTTLPLAVSGGVTGTLSVGSISLGKNLQDTVTVALSAPAPAAGQPVTVTSGDSTKLLIATGIGPAAQLVTSIPGGQTSINIAVQALDSSGVVSLTASAPGLSGQGNITLAPSAFVISGGSGFGGSFNTTQGANTTISVYPARLDSSNSPVQIQTIRTGFSVSVPLNLSSGTVGSVTPASATFNGGDNVQTVTFLAKVTGNVNPASTTITAGVPLSGGFVTPAGSTNVVTAFIAGAGMSACNTTVGKGLAAKCNITLFGSASGLLTIALHSNSPDLLFSNNGTSAGLSDINVTVAVNHTGSSDFYVYGLKNTGSATYTVSEPSLGSVTGTVTFAPSGIIISGPNLGVDFTTTTQGTVGVGVFSALLTAAGDFVGLQNVAGPNAIAVNTTNTPIPPAANVGTLNPSQLTISPGSSGAVASFVPSGVGSTTLGLQQPAGFTAPNQYTSVVATVNDPGINVPVPGYGVGYHLQAQLTAILGGFAPAGQVFTITSNDPNLLVSSDPTLPGQSQTQITLTASAQGFNFYVYGLNSSGNPGFTVSSPGFKTFTGTIPLTASGIILFGPGFGNSVFTTVGTPAAVTAATVQLDPNTGVFLGFQPAAAGLPLTVQLTNGNAAVGTLATPSITFNGNDSLVDDVFTPKAAGTSTVSILSVPPNFTVLTGFGSVLITVN